MLQVAEETVADDDMIMLKGCKNTRAVTVLLRGANDYMLDEMDRSLHDAFCIVKRVLESGTVVAGAFKASLLHFAARTHLQRATPAIPNLPLFPSHNMCMLFSDRASAQACCDVGTAFTACHPLLNNHSASLSIVAIAPETAAFHGVLLLAATGGSNWQDRLHRQGLPASIHTYQGM